jgi:hypothetical protein
LLRPQGIRRDIITRRIGFYIRCVEIHGSHFLSCGLELNAQLDVLMTKLSSLQAADEFFLSLLLG